MAGWDSLALVWEQGGALLALLVDACRVAGAAPQERAFLVPAGQRECAAGLSCSASPWQRTPEQLQCEREFPVPRTQAGSYRAICKLCVVHAESQSLERGY
jgi:hypothetical protein